MSNRNRKRATAVLGALAAVAIAAVAIAYRTGPGAGPGSAEVGTNGSVTLTGTVASGSAPGTSEPVSFTAANPSESPIRISSVHLVSIAVDEAHAACDT